MSHLRSKDADLFVYLSWATEGAFPLLDTDQLQQAAYLAITTRARSQFCHLLAIGGTASRLHLVCRFPASLSITSIVKIGQSACAEAVARLWETIERGRREPSPLWERTYTARTLSSTEAGDARDFVCRRIAEIAPAGNPPPHAERSGHGNHPRPV